MDWDYIMICTALLSTFLLFGDSRCWVNEPGNPALHSYIQAVCPTATILSDCSPGRGVFANGWGGPPASDLAARVALNAPDACLLMLGVNDTGFAPEQIAAGMKALGDVCVAGGAVPVLVTGFPIADGWTAGKAAWNERVMDRQVEMARGLGWVVIETHRAFDPLTFKAACTVNPATGLPDGVHPYAATCKGTAADYIGARLP